MNTLRGKCAGVAAILLLIISGYSNAEVTKNTILERQAFPIVMDASGDYAGLNIINLDEMSTMRGGFSIAGLDLTFGATLRTLIDNIKLETVFNITAAGAEIVSQVLSDISGLNEAVTAVSQQAAATETLSAAGDGAASSVQPASVQTTNVQPAEVNNSVAATSNTDVSAAAGSTVVLVGPETGVSVTDLAPVGISLDGLGSDNNFSGVVVSNNKGFTAALHRLTQNAAINAIVSNASNLRVSQKLDIKIEIANTRAARSAAKAAALSQWANSLRR